MLDGKRSAGVAPEVNLRNPLQASDKLYKGESPWLWNLGQILSEVKNRIISDHTKPFVLTQKVTTIAFHCQ